MHVLQLSALCLVPPVALAMQQSRWAVGLALCVTLGTSLVVHRPNRGPAREAADRLDEFSIAVWVVCNAHLLLHLALLPLDSPEMAMSGLALLAATACGALDQWRRQLRWRSPERNAAHCSMHLAGAIGTGALLWVAARRGEAGVSRKE